ncbi:unnamed protein product [Phytophthora fragariaefolia]|uniref:RxLR effector protein n=1 Tax=Phytophthora fragariaefolia TaxID=1490495 RepID=A0A9W6YMW3_9STRA|nr:unnamed protein product [Phytophthora fragariaefolia]
MRLYYVVMMAVAGLMTGSSATPDSADTSKIAYSSTQQDLHSFTGEQNGDNSKRFLRTRETTGINVDTEERRLVNVDVAIGNFITKLKKKTLWKAEFAAWKLLKKKPSQLELEWGVYGKGHPLYKKARAYRSYYSIGPLNYP